MAHLLPQLIALTQPVRVVQVWMGDMNYRLTGIQPEEAAAMVAEGNLSKLMEYDELKAALGGKKVPPPPPPQPPPPPPPPLPPPCCA